MGEGINDDSQLWHTEVPGGSNRFVCGLRRHSDLVSFDFWESGLLDLWVRQLDARTDDCKHKGNLFYQG